MLNCDLIDTANQPLFFFFIYKKKLIGIAKSKWYDKNAAHIYIVTIKFIKTINIIREMLKSQYRRNKYQTYLQCVI